MFTRRSRPVRGRERRLAPLALCALVSVTAASATAVGTPLGAGAQARTRTPAPTRSRGGRRCLVPGSSETIDQLWQPDISAAIRYARGRTGDIWGETSVTARDQTRFFLDIDGDVDVDERHRSYAMRLLRSVIPSERWGIAELPPRGWKLYFKGGWGYGTGLLDHQVALLTRGCAQVSIAVLTMYDGSHAYGKQTLRGIFSRLLRRFPSGRSDRDDLR